MKQKPLTPYLINTFGEEKLYNIWKDNNGMYGAAKVSKAKLGIYVSPYVWRYLSHKLNWKRQIDNLDLPLIKGLLAGNVPEEYYKHIIITST